ncbi:DUF2894 domain-containing protein [Pandoraea sp.]|uniref:DUF2894 domain-containing protein n=1 Tax=Pandoraea sp. TaxID=1883445 RepID=UPI0035B23970
MHDAMHDATTATNSHDVPDPVFEQLDAWRAQGVDKRDPARFHRIEALALRSRSYSGPVRQVLDDRLKALVDELVQSLGSARATPTSSALPALPALTALTALPAPPALTAASSDGDCHIPQCAASPLAALTAVITQRVGVREPLAPSTMPRTAKATAPARQTHRAGESTQPVGVFTPPPPTTTTTTTRPIVAPAAMPVLTVPTVIATDNAFEDLDVLEYFRETWSKLSTDGNLRQSLAQVPENAGPLNSSHLVHRALSLMHDVSPDYLRHFLRHADALSWLEDMETTGVLGNKATARAPVKPSRAKSR